MIYSFIFRVSILTSKMIVRVSHTSTSHDVIVDSAPVTVLHNQYEKCLYIRV